MKKKIPGIIFGLMFLIGFGILMYPTVADRWNAYRQSRLISSYEDTISQMTEEDFTAEWEKARSYNDSLTRNTIYGDAFGKEGQVTGDSQYQEALNVGGDGIMGYISIPKIDVQLSIYHGTSEEVLQTGAGHLYGTKLPIGGKSTHSALAAHRGLPSAKLFTDLDQMEEGDLFFIHILDETLAYEVDQILTVEPDQVDALDIVEGEDYCTLVTCTPYGVNSHRLLVRGHRTEVPETQEAAARVTGEVQRENSLIWLIPPLLLVLLLLVIIIRRVKKSRKGDNRKNRRR